MDEATKDAMIAYATDLADLDNGVQYAWRQERQHRGLTSLQIAEQLEESEDWVHNVEHGDPTLSDIRRYMLAVAFPGAT